MKTKYYLAVLDIGGLRTETPVLICKKSPFNQDIYTEDTENPYFRINVKKPNLYSYGDVIGFWSKNRKDVENFILGVKAANTAISELVKSKLNH